jgi:hypothetical protein
MSGIGVFPYLGYTDLGTGKVTNLVEITITNNDFLPNSNRISESEDLVVAEYKNIIIYIDNAHPSYEINFWYLRLFSLFNIILMIITIIYSHKSKIINKNVYIIFLCLDILSILVNIFFTLFLLRKNFIFNFKIKNLYDEQEILIVIYFCLNIILTSIVFYFIIDSLYGYWVDEGSNRSTLRWVISVFSILEFIIMAIIEIKMEKKTQSGRTLN